MSLTIEDKLKMLKSVQYTLLTNSDITSSFASEVGKYDGYLQKIRELSQKINRDVDSPGTNDLEENIRQASNKIAEAIRSYAAMAGRTDLMTNENIKSKVIEKSTGEELFNNCIKILETAKENLISINLFGVNEGKLHDYENMIFYYSKLKDNKNSTPAADVNVICEEAVRFLEDTLDTLVEQAKNSFPKFYNEYKYARTTSEEKVDKIHFFA